MTTLFEELGDIGLDLFINLSERGASHAQNHHEVGERIAASQSRLTSADQLRDAISAALQALRSGGWDGTSTPIGLVMDASHDDGADGREFALRGAISDGRVMVSAQNADPDAARSAFSLRVPEGSVHFGARTDDELFVDFRYLSQGYAARADDDMERAFRDAGVRFYGYASQQTTR